MEFSAWLTKCQYDESKLTDQMRKHLTAAWEAEEGNPELAELRDRRRLGPMNFVPAGAGGASAACDALSAAMCISAGMMESDAGRIFGQNATHEAVSREFRGASYHTLIRATLAAAGRAVPVGRIGDQHIREAFEVSQMRADVGPSTITVPGILSNVANKSSLAAFDSVPVTWQKFCRVVDLRDFKAATQYRLIGSGVFEQIVPGGEIKAGSLTESTFSLQADTWGKLIAISRRDIINDDLTMFSQVPKVLGRMSALKLERSVYETLIGNAGSFFSSGNANESTGSTNSAMTLLGLTNAYKLFQEMLDPNNEPTMIVPRILLSPPALEMAARNLVRSVEVVGALTTPVPAGNAFAGMFEPVSSPWLATATGLIGSSDTAWYLLTGPGDYSVIQVGFLNGQQMPTVQTAELDFDQLGIAMRAYHDFGVALFEHRGGVLSTGA